MPSVLGVDLVAVSEVARSVDRFGDRYLSRVYTPAELAYCHGTKDAASHLAARFAAKEATFKALRAGDVGFDWRSVEVVRLPDGSCELSLHDAMAGVARSRGVVDLRLSLSHDGGFAVAVVAGDVETPSHVHGRNRAAFRIARKSPIRSHR